MNAQPSVCLTPTKVFWRLDIGRLAGVLVLLALLLPASLSAATRDTQWQVTEIYIATMGYAPDAEGLDYWVSNIQTLPQWTPTTVAQSFFDQPLVQAEYPSDQGYGPFIEALYQNIFGRAVDSEGYAYWLGELESGRVQRNQMVIALIEGGWANPGAATDMARFGNRVEVGLAFADYQREHGITYSALSTEKQEYLREVGLAVLSDVDDDVAVEAAVSRLDDLFSSIIGIVAITIPNAFAGNQLSLLSGLSFETQAIEVSFSAGDNATALEFMIIEGPSWMQINASSGVIRLQAPIVTRTESWDFILRALTDTGHRDLSGVIAVEPALDSGSLTATGDAQTVTLAGVKLEIEAGNLPSGTTVSVARGQTREGRSMITIRTDGASADLGAVRIWLSSDDATQALAEPFAEVVASEYCDGFADYALDHRDKWFFSGLWRLTESYQFVITMVPELGDIFFVERPASALCSKFSSRSEIVTQVSDRDPVLFIHGYTPLSGLGGGEVTWKELLSTLYDVGGILPFEFRWVTNASFVDVAKDLRQAVTKLNELTGKRVHIVAHSFGGLLARTYLQGLDYGRVVTHDPPAMTLTTVGTPHSGIFSTETTEFPRGIDTSLTGAATDICVQTSCYEAGSRSGGYIPNHLYSHYSEQGGLIADLNDEANAFPDGLPVQVLMGLRRFPPRDGWVVYTDGDGLISFEGQRFRPDRRTTKDLLGNQTQLDTVELESQLGAQVREVLLNTDAANPDFPGQSVLEHAFPGFGHTKSHIACALNGRAVPCPADFPQALEGEVWVRDSNHPLVDYLRVFIHQFGTSPVDGWRPHVLSTSPVNGSTDVSTATRTIQVVFDRPMDTTEWAVTGDDVWRPADSYWLDSRTFIVGREDQDTALPEGIQVEVGLNGPLTLNPHGSSGFHDADGVRLAPYVLSFTTETNQSEDAPSDLLAYWDSSREVVAITDTTASDVQVQGLTCSHGRVEIYGDIADEYRQDTGEPIVLFRTPYHPNEGAHCDAELLVTRDDSQASEAIYIDLEEIGALPMIDRSRRREVSMLFVDTPGFPRGCVQSVGTAIFEGTLNEDLRGAGLHVHAWDRSKWYQGLKEATECGFFFYDNSDGSEDYLPGRWNLAEQEELVIGSIETEAQLNSYYYQRQDTETDEIVGTFDTRFISRTELEYSRIWTSPRIPADEKSLLWEVHEKTTEAPWPTADDFEFRWTFYNGTYACPPDDTEATLDLFVDGNKRATVTPGSKTALVLRGGDHQFTVRYPDGFLGGPRPFHLVWDAQYDFWGCDDDEFVPY